MSKSPTLLGISVLCALALSGCAKEVKPEGPVLTPFERSRDFARTNLAPVVYSSGIPPLSQAPVLPFMGFGLAYDVDVVVGPKSDKIDSIEVARMQTAAGPLWMVLEAGASDKQQTLMASVEDMDTWMPELSLARRTTNLVVQDKTTTDGLDLLVTYDNAEGRAVEMTLQGQPALELTKSGRNGPTMGVNANSLLTVNDVSSMESLFKAEVRVDDERMGARKLGGLLPYQFTTTKASGGIATGTYFQELRGAPMAFEVGASKSMAKVWTEKAPPPMAPTIPSPMNPAPDEVVLLPMDQWESLDAESRQAALDAQEAKLESCLVAGQAADPDYKGVVAVDFYVQGGKPYEVTVDENSTGAELVMTCAQTIASAYAFDEALDGAIRIEIGTLPMDHEATNDLEQAWLDAQPKAEDAEDADETPAEDAALEDKPDEGGMDDLLDGEDMEEKPVDTGAAPLRAFDTVHTLANGTKVAQSWNIHRQGDRVWVTQDSDSRSLRYEFMVKGDDSVLELRSIQVVPWGQAVPTTAITFSPALPDLRRPFSGKIESKFVIDVGGQGSHATGTAVSSFGDSGVKVKLSPSAPEWAKATPITSTVNFKNGMPYVSTVRAD